MVTSDFSVGERVYGIGLDMNCHKVLTTFIIHRFFPKRNEHGQDCVIKCDDGCLVMDDSRTFFKYAKDVIAAIA